MPFAKGHGTGNDFVIVPDTEGRLSLKPEDVALLCDRRRGIGGDGLLRVVPAESGSEAEWFMDYHNADGSIAEMCGNGLRVFVRYLLDTGLADGDVIPVDTRAGLKTAVLDGENIRVDMGPAEFGEASSASLDHYTWAGQSVSMGNPHLVCQLSESDDLQHLDLHYQPVFDAEVFPEGVNVEFVTGHYPHVAMRVHERGVGETLSCGTGVAAVAAVALNRHDADAKEGHVTVDVPGGRLEVDITPETVFLSGPAVVVAEGTTTLA
ncbi:diaminopimelate epimerase [Salininema proteolyticum]|uniref:Diaminopimelate epimerase n=1 Tax=Salininema proteolyticum TaxID=1607685 RepID=A0ABV8U0I5_9ACTN